MSDDFKCRFCGSQHEVTMSSDPIDFISEENPQDNYPICDNCFDQRVEIAREDFKLRDQFKSRQ